MSAQVLYTVAVLRIVECTWGFDLTKAKFVLNECKGSMYYSMLNNTM